MSYLLPDIDDPSTLPTGDMPGDRVEIGASHIAKARTVLPVLMELLEPVLEHSPHHRAVVSVHGGSGVGKSEVGSLLAHYLRANGLGSYVMSGDNYPRRIPAENDAERARVFRDAAMRAVSARDDFSAAARDELAALQATGQDSDPAQATGRPWLEAYQRAGRRALAAYLGSDDEIDFGQVNGILAAFHDGAPELVLKRMGRTPDQLWYDRVDVRDVQVLVIEWTHGNNDLLHGVDVPVLLNSTPAETLAHRRSRARDGAVDSPFTTMVLGLEQAKLHAQSPRARIIVTRDGEVVDHATYLALMGADLPSSGPMLNLYPDSVGGTLADVVDLMRHPAVAGAFDSAYVLPSLFNSDLDRGFSVIDYDLDERYATRADLDALAEQGIALKLDFILNHASVLSPQFQDLLRRGQRSPYKDFFIDWNRFWAGHGEMTDDGFIQPDPELIEGMFFRKPGLPILMVRMPDGTERPYWNTFYQQVRHRLPDPEDLMEAAGLPYGRATQLRGRLDEALQAGRRPGEADFTGFEEVREDVVEWMESRRRYLGQMDLDITSPLVWEFYAETLDKLAGHGAEIVRLDAFAYAPKGPGERNFLNDPGTWELLDRVRALADARGLRLLPEIHATHQEGIHELISSKGFLTYDFFLPGLLVHALETHSTVVLKRWIDELLTKQIRTVNMLGCHDGIPLLDLKGLLSDDEIEHVIDVVRARGGHVKDLHGAKTMYYQVNATYFSALGEDERALLLARAVQLFMPGKPQVWYLDLFAGRNDHAAVERAGEGGHKEINRTNLTVDEVAAGLERPVVLRQLELLRFRRSFGAFGFDATCTVEPSTDERLVVTWTKDGLTARLEADLASLDVVVTGTDASGAEVFGFTS